MIKMLNKSKNYKMKVEQEFKNLKISKKSLKMISQKFKIRSTENLRINLSSEKTLSKSSSTSFKYLTSALKNK